MELAFLLGGKEKHKYKGLEVYSVAEYLPRRYKGLILSLSLKKNDGRW
jgi:hypothetical protein